MEALKTFFKTKDKKKIYNLAAMFLAGVALLVLSSTLFKKPGGEAQAVTSSPVMSESGPEHVTSYEEDLEKRLESVLGLVEGAGKVKVMITLSYGREQIIAENSRTEETSNIEEDGQGGSRQQQSANSQREYVIITQKDGSQTPLVTKEIEPAVAGVIIIAEGGGNIVVKAALTKAAYTVLDIEPHMVQVLKMKS